MQNRLIKIGDFAAMNNCSVQALRHYEKISLLKPAMVDENSGYRYYHISQSGILDNIQYLKQFDFSLKEIAEIFQDEEIPKELHAKIETMRRHLLEEKHALEQKLREIDRYQQGASLFQEKWHSRELELQNFPVRYVHAYSTTENIYEMNDEEYEQQLRFFKTYISRLSWRPTAFSKVGSIISREDFARGRFYSNKMFIQLEEPASAAYIALPEGLYALCYVRSFAEEISTLPLFLQAVTEQSYQVLGDYICEVLYEYSNSKQRRRDFFIRMQVLVAPV